MELLRASLVLVIALPAALSHQPPFHSQIISLAPIADATFFRDRTGYAHTQILPSGPNYHHPQRVIQRVVTEAHHVPLVQNPLVAHHPIVAHHPVVHQAIVHQPVAHHPIIHHAPPPVLVTVQKAASPLVYHSYAPITAYARPAGYETHYPATLTTTYKQPAYTFPAAVAYKHPVTTTKVIETHPQVVTAQQATYVAPVPTGRAIVTSYFNVPGGGRRADDANFPSWSRTTSADTPKTAVPDPLISVGSTGARLQGQDPMYGQDVGWRTPVASSYGQSAWPARLAADWMKKQGQTGFYRSKYPAPTRLEDWPASFQSSSRQTLASGQAATKQGWDYGNQAQAKWSAPQNGDKQRDDDRTLGGQDSAENNKE